MSDKRKDYFAKAQDLYFDEKNYTDTFKLLFQGSESGDPRCDRFIGWLYYNGHGCECNKEEALKWFKKAAINFDVQGWFGVGYIYYDKRSYDKAFYYFRLASKEEFAPATLKLGIMYQHGLGVDKNLNKAEKCYKQAAMQGHLAGAIAYCGFLLYGNRGLLGRFKAVLLFIPVLIKVYWVYRKDPHSIKFMC